MSHPLQNHPGQRELPARASVRNLMLDRRSNGALPTAASSTVILGLLVLFMLWRIDLGPWQTMRTAGWDLGPVLDEVDKELLVFWAVAAVIGLGLLSLGAWIFVSALRRPMREQRRYYSWHGTPEPDAWRRRAMRVGASWMYLNGAWPLTMEYFPTAAGLTPRQVRWFRTFLPEPADADRDELASSWGILNAQAATEAIETYLSNGIHSEVFAASLREDGLTMADHVAALADVPTDEVMALVDAHDGRPPQLLWGWDLIRTSVIVRGCVGAGYLSDEQALGHLETITDLVTAIFPDEESLVRNCEIGFGLWAGAESRADLRSRRELGRAYLASSWPEQLGPWPTPSDRELPQAMAEGFGWATDRRDLSS